VIDIVNAVLAQASTKPDEVAIVDKDGAVTTFGQLRDRILAVRDGLRAQGLGSGDGVLFAVRTSATGIALFLGVLAAGAVLITADTAVGPELVAARMREYRPRWLIAESILYPASVFGPMRSLCRRRGWSVPDLRQAIADPTIRHVYSGRWLPGVPGDAIKVGDLSGPTAAPEVDLDAPALVVFTSGTTSRPKGVVHTLRTLTNGMQLLASHFPFKEGDAMHTDVIVAALPALVSGARLSLTTASPERFAKDLTERAVTHAYGVPVQLAEVFDVLPKWPEHVRYLLMGSAPAAAAVLRQAMNAVAGGQVLSVYAMTEVLPIAVARAEDKLAHTEQGHSGDLLGQPSDGVGARIAEDGELLVSGPNVCRGYLGRPSMTELPTGDLARLDDRGRIIMLGRKKNMLIRGSYNIYPGLYEPSITLLPGVREAAMVGLPDPVTEDETVVLAVVADAGVDVPALTRRLRRQLPDIIDAEAVPDRIVVLDELPRSGRSRKLDRPALRAVLAGRDT
jgi:acyl-CoA synthetase (AMP-forming)/AMP-acid ligase II